MTFTYDLSTDIGKIRLEINDKSDGTGGQAKLTDEEIQYAIDNGGDSYGYWVCFAIELIMQQLADPEFQADWLTVKPQVAYASHEKMLALKRQRYEIPDGTGLTTGTIGLGIDFTEDDLEEWES